ncbi:DUF6510 family protein [Streptomyces sp. NRRL B-24720]|uniref:DUF6510 family protein n=1 Tax=Streptomyces sp. NRRL B-24720 TaxID=1476876 RepID=UPI00068C8B3D|nr:DUF6510 family protein [Streptomyces sp. NRRL B-24720]
MVFVETNNPDVAGAPDGHVDGNALAGPLSEIFVVDMTAATSRCAHCGCTAPLACLHVYERAPGLVARCQRCGQVVLRVVRAKGVVWLDMSGASSLAIPLGEE